MLLGALSIASYAHAGKKALRKQVALSVLFIILSVILNILLLVVFHMAGNSLSIGNFASAIITLALAFLTNKGFPFKKLK